MTASDASTRRERQPFTPRTECHEVARLRHDAATAAEHRFVSLQGVRYLPAIVLSLVILAIAPFMSLLRDVLFARFGQGVIPALTVGVVAACLASLAAAVWSIRTRRLLRWGGLMVVAVALWLQVAGLSTGLPQVDAVEKIHIVEYGLLAVLLYRAALAGWRRSPHDGEAGPSLLVLPFLGVVLVGTLDELTQWFFQLRVGEMRDVLLNLAAGSNGLLASLCVWPPRRLRARPCRAERVRMLLTAALVVLVVGVFVDRAHLGHAIDDPEVGRFVSFHAPDELQAAAVDRAWRWAAAPPQELRAWAREDLFLTEAAFHVQHRNERKRAGDAYMAWQANRILERWYGPFLDLESFRGSGRHRWWPDGRDKIEQSVFGAETPPPPPSVYRSPVLVGRVWLLPRTPFRVAVGLLALTLAAAGLVAARRRVA
ncbi:MAG: VanZ family protein [Acidobacteriota bacterium]